MEFTATVPISHVHIKANTGANLHTFLHLSRYPDHQPKIDVRTHKLLGIDQASLEALQNTA